MQSSTTSLKALFASAYEAIRRVVSSTGLPSSSSSAGKENPEAPLYGQRRGV